MALSISPVAVWEMNEASGTSLADATGNGYTATTHNSPTVGATGKIGNGVTWANASTQYADVPHNAAFNSANYSVCAWIKRAGTPSEEYIFGHNVGTSGDNYGWDFGLYGNKIMCLHQNVALCQSATEITDTNWHHVGYTYDGSTVRFYLDGVADGTASSGAFTAQTTTITIAAFKDTGASGAVGKCFTGTLDQIAYFGGVLTADDFSILYNNGNGEAYNWSSITNRLRAYWKLDESSGTSFADATGNGHTLTGSSSGLTLGATGKINTAVTIDGNDGHWLRRAWDSQLAYNAQFSMSLWLKRSATGSRWDGLAAAMYYEPGVTADGWTWYIDSDDSIRFVNQNVADDGTSGGVLSDTNWHHLVMTYDNGTVKIYVDASLVGTLSVGTMSTAHNGQYFWVGINESNVAGDPSTGHILRGTMDEFGYWNRVLSSTEVTSLYNGGSALAYPFSGSTTYTVTAGYGTTTETGQAVTPRHVHKLAAAAGTTTETGQAVTPRQVKIVTAAYGTTSESGQAVTLTNKYNLVAGAGTTSETGQSVTLRQVQYLTAAYGTTTETGQGATPRQVKILTAGTGTTSESGQDVTLTIIGTNRLVADYGTTTITGQAVAIRHVRTLTAGTGTTTETGQGASIIGRAVVGAGIGTTSETGQPVALVIKYILGAGTGTTAETGQEVYLVLSSETVTLRGRLTVSAVSTHRTFAESQKSSTTKTQPVSTRTTYTEAP